MSETESITFFYNSYNPIFKFFKNDTSTEKQHS
jgi:hypothetical protein